MKKYILLIVLGIFILQSCEKAKKKPALKSENTSNLNAIKMHKDSAAFAWKRMMLNDDQKFKNMISLLDNISYIPGSNEKEIKELKLLVEKTWKTRYDSSQMTAAIVDGFDEKTSELIGKIFTLAEKTKGIEKYANVSTLQQEIFKADNTNLMLDRAHYDKWAKNYNNLITKEHTKTSGGSLPLFESLN